MMNALGGRGTLDLAVVVVVAWSGVYVVFGDSGSWEVALGELGDVIDLIGTISMLSVVKSTFQSKATLVDSLLYVSRSCYRYAGATHSRCFLSDSMPSKPSEVSTVKGTLACCPERSCCWMLDKESTKLWKSSFWLRTG